MSANLSFGALMIDESSTNMQIHQEQAARSVKLYPDNDLYACLEFEYNTAEARRAAAKQLYKIYLESDGQYQAVVNEAGAGVAVAALVAVIAAAIAAITKLFGKGSSIASNVEAKIDVAAHSLGKNSSQIPTDDPHYNDEMDLNMPKVGEETITTISICGIEHVIMEATAREVILELSKYPNDSAKRKEIIQRYKDNWESEFDKMKKDFCKDVYGDENATSFTIINERKQPAGELYNKYIAPIATVVKDFPKEYKAFRDYAVSMTKNLESHKANVKTYGGTLKWDNAEAEKDANIIVNAFSDNVKAVTNFYTVNGNNVQKAIERIANVVNQFQSKFGRMSREDSRKRLGLSDAAFDANYGDLSLTEAASPLHYSSVGAADYKFDDPEPPITESALPFAGLFSVNEESFIHGEPFDGDTLYDEKDYQDFNRTDWVNLGLGEHYKDLENQGRIEEAAFKQECLYRSQPGFSIEKLQRLNEEVAETSKKGWARAMDTLKQLIQKFVEKLYGAFGSNKPYLDRYKKTIVDGQTPAVPFFSSGDIFVGMDRIMNVGVPLLNYSQMKNDLGDIGTFYTKWILPIYEKNMSGGRWGRFRRSALQKEGTVNVADESKKFFGYGDPNAKLEWQLTDLNKDDWQEIFNWLYDVKKIRDSIKKDQRSIEDSVHRIDVELKKAEKLNADAKNGTAKPNTNIDTTPPADKPEVQKNSAYSYVYGCVITEGEFGDAPASGGNNGGANNAKATNTTGDGYKDTNAALKDINSTNPDSTEAVRKAMNNYLAAAKAVLTAKMTALEFVRKELFQIIRHKVQFNQRQNGQQQQTGQGQQDPKHPAKGEPSETINQGRRK